MLGQMEAFSKITATHNKIYYDASNKPTLGESKGTKLQHNYSNKYKWLKIKLRRQ